MWDLSSTRFVAVMAGACLLASACSDDASDPSPSGMGGDGTSSGDGDGDGDNSGDGDGDASGGRRGAGGSAMGGDGMGGSPTEFPAEPNCSGVTELTAGTNYGAYSLFAVRRDTAAAPGEYTIRVLDGSDGTAYVYREDELIGEFDYDPSAPLQANTLQTIAFDGLFELDLRSQTEDDLSALDETIFDGCHAIAVIESAAIEQGDSFGPFLLSDLNLDPNAPSGTYTFYSASGNDGSVDLLLDGMVVDTLTYDWMTTIGGGESFTFEFSDVASLTITRSMGTSNLFGLADNLFDGLHELIVP